MSIISIIQYIIFSLVLIFVIHKGFEFCKNYFTEPKTQDLEIVSQKYKKMYKNLANQSSSQHRPYYTTNHNNHNNQTQNRYSDDFSEDVEQDITLINNIVSNTSSTLYDTPVQLPPIIPPSFKNGENNELQQHPLEGQLPVIYNDRLKPISSAKDKPLPPSHDQNDEYGAVMDYNFIKERLGQYDKPTVTENKMQPNPHQLLEQITTIPNPFESINPKNQSNRPIQPEQIQFNTPI